MVLLPLCRSVVYRTIPTSNHNFFSSVVCRYKLYIVLFLHQTTTVLHLGETIWLLYIVLFLHQTTTLGVSCPANVLLYIVLFLHQTTTMNPTGWHNLLLYIVLFLHQTTTVFKRMLLLLSCISYYSYIKPQLTLIMQLIMQSCISYYSYIKPQRSP